LGKIEIKRFPENPLISPSPKIWWMTKNAFNPGVVKKGNYWYMLIRGAYTDDQSYSNLGLALSKDGKKFKIFKEPVLCCKDYPFAQRGIEDPRIVPWIDGFNYVFATVLREEKGEKIGRIGIWRTKDFKNYEWVGIPFDWDDKNSAILPEPIDGKVFLIHRKLPHIWMSETKDLTLRSGWRNSKILVKSDEFYLYQGQKPLKIGLAGPPQKTKKGYLAIVHVRHKDEKFQRRYTLSFIVLNQDNPRQVDYIHSKPILEPEKDYEIYGIVENVVFSCATIDANEKEFYIYYGGTDTVICGGVLKKKDLKGICY
jgi:predicted GH43/DUF377 family glycosyl hydrolase